MQKITFFLTVTLIALFSASLLKAQNLDKEIEAIIAPLIASISSQPVKNVAISDFTSLDGTSSELGKYLAEEFSFSLVNAKKSFIVIDRSRVSALLKENGLGGSGMMDPNTIAKLGKMKGIDAVIAGTLTSTGNSLRLIIKVWNLETQGLMSASKGDISKTPMIIELEGKGVSGGTTSGGTSYTPKTISPSTTSGPKFTKDNWVFEVTSCIQTGDRVECRIRVTSIGKDFDLEPSGIQRIISSSGNEYQLDEIKLGDKLNQRKSFVADVPVNCVFVASKVNEKIDNISKFESVLYSAGSSGNQVIAILRNIKVK